MTEGFRAAKVYKACHLQSPPVNTRDGTDQMTPLVRFDSTQKSAVALVEIALLALRVGKSKSTALQ